MRHHQSVSCWLADGVLGAGSRDGLLNALHWSVSYVDSSFLRILKPQVFIDLGAPRVNEIEDEGNRSVRFHRARLRDVVLCNMPGHSVVFVVFLRHSPEESHCMCSDGRVEVEVFLWCVTEGSGSKGGGTHGETFWAYGVDDGALCGTTSVLFAGLMLLE